MARLGGLATPRGPTDHHNALARHRAKELLAVFSHRQPLAQLLEPRINSSKWFSGSERGVLGCFHAFLAIFMRFSCVFGLVSGLIKGFVLFQQLLALLVAAPQLVGHLVAHLLQGELVLA